VAEARRAGPFRWRAARSGATASSILDRAQVSETAAKHFAGAAGQMLVAVDAARLGEGLKWSARAATSCSRIFMGRCSLDAVQWSVPLPWAPMAAHVFPELAP